MIGAFGSKEREQWRRLLFAFRSQALLHPESVLCLLSIMDQLLGERVRRNEMNDISFSESLSCDSFRLPDESSQIGSPVKRIEREDGNTEPDAQAAEELTHEGDKVKTSLTADRLEDGVRSGDLEAQFGSILLGAGDPGRSDAVPADPLATSASTVVREKRDTSTNVRIQHVLVRQVKLINCFCYDFTVRYFVHASVDMMNHAFSGADINANVLVTIRVIRPFFEGKGNPAEGDRVVTTNVFRLIQWYRFTTSQDAGCIVT